MRIKPGKGVYLRNAYEFIDKEGEWYYNRQSKVLYYMPLLGQDMTTAVVMIPKVENLVSLKVSFDF